jgi:hypothetical protein
MSDNEIEDPNIWPDARLVQAEQELAAEKARRAAALVADHAATLSPEDREKAENKRLGEKGAVEGRREVYEKHGFDPGWRG